DGSRGTGRGTPLGAAAPYGLGLPRRRPRGRDDPRHDEQEGRGVLGRPHGRPPRPGRGPQAAQRRPADGSGQAARRRVLRRPRHARHRPLGGQPEVAMGIVHARRPVDPALGAAAGDAAVGDRLRARPRARAPARAGARRQVLGVGRPLPTGRAGQGLPHRLVGRCRHGAARRRRPGRL
ncbi:MAG: Zinc metalloprotease, partial [uncultured Nocardioides sp.]